jgi:hypothetical protein
VDAKRPRVRAKEGRSERYEMRASALKQESDMLVATRLLLLNLRQKSRRC